MKNYDSYYFVKFQITAVDTGEIQDIETKFYDIHAATQYYLDLYNWRDIGLEDKEHQEICEDIVHYSAYISAVYGLYVVTETRIK